MRLGLRFTTGISMSAFIRYLPLVLLAAAWEAVSRLGRCRR
jgi:hypothetical protein